MSVLAGFKYYYNFLGIGTGSYQLDYSFNDNSGVLIPNSGNNQNFTGNLIGNPTTFYSNPGNGFFNTGTYIHINNTNQITGKDWTIYTVYEKTGIGNGVIFSNFHSTSGIYSGCAIGVNDANKLYLETYDNNGANVITSQKTFARKNAVSITKAGDNLSLGYFNFNNKSLELENFTVSDTYFYPSNEWYIGAAINPPTHFNQNTYNGYIDEFIYISEAINPTYSEKLFSGFYSEVSPDIQTITSTGYNSVSGIFSGVTSAYTGVTGYSVTITGSGIDSCNFDNTINYYLYTPLTGTITGGNILILSGINNSLITGVTKGILSINSGVITEFGMDDISWMKPIVSSEIYTFSGYQNTNHNKISQFDFSYNKFELDDLYSNNQVQLYIDGLAKLPSGYAYTGNYYSQGLQLSGDYFITGYYVESTGAFQLTDTCIYDLYSGQKSTYNFTGVNNTGQTYTVSDPFSNINDFVFLNGIKLVSGIDYSHNGTNITINYQNNKTYNSGNLYIFNFNDTFFREYGNLTGYTGFRFLKDSSMVWQTGVRQIINQDFIENSQIDLLKYSGIFNTGFSGIYDDNGLFWN